MRNPRKNLNRKDGQERTRKKMSKKITLENVDSSELPEVPVIGEVKQIRFTQDMELVSTLADSDLFMIQAGADLEARPNTITFDLIIKNLSGPIEEGSKKFVTGDMMFKVIGDMNLLDTWDNTNLVNSLNATYVNVRRIEEELRREINRSTGKDEQHDEQIANLRQDLTSTNEMLNQEINRSVAKDNEHDELLEGLRDDVDSTSDKLDAEIDRSTAKDAEHDTLLKGLRVDVNANKSAIESEVARSTARDEAHDAAISKNASDIATETSRAKAEEAKIRQEMQAADTNLQNAITAETERATGVEEDLQRQITDLSGSTDDRLEALEALSHEQNTDTGTTSKTFVIDSGNTGAMLKAEGGGLSTRTKGDAGYANFTVQNLVIKGDVTQEGDTFITQAERVEVRDNMILINEGETGAGVTAGFAGIEVDRGTEQNFMFGFNESDGMFKIGKEGNMFDVALRQPVGDMIDGMFASWDAATKTFKTTNVIPYNKSLDFKFDPEIVDATLKMKFMEAGLGLSMSGDDSILALLPGMPQDEVKYSLISTNTNGIILGDSSGSNDKFILDIKKPSFISPVLDKNVIIGGKNAYFSYYSHRVGSPNTIIASCGVKAPSFYRASDNAEVLYSLDQARLTDGMFLSWDKTNKRVVTTNLIPPTQQLYLGTSDVGISYNEADGGSIRLRTSEQSLNIFTRSGYTNFKSTLNKFQFTGDVSISTGKLNTVAATFNISVAGGNSMVIDGTGSTLSTPLTSTTYYRSSDNSEVLYQADLKSVLTGKETNYAPTVKAVSDAIDAVNTGTTESLKEYLKLRGGTMTGPIVMNNSIVLKSKDVNGVERRLIGKSSEGTTHIGDIDGKAQIHTSDTDVIHFRSTGAYTILDSYNLPDPATKSGNNAFTGTNSFVGGKFSVAGSESEVCVSAVGNLVTRSTYGTTGWTRSLEFSDNDVVVARFGVKAITTDNVPTTDFVGILVGNGTVNDSQYKFSLNKMEVPSVFILSTANGVSKILSASSGRMKFGDYQCECYLESKNVDLIHNKNNVAYKIWDASNLPTPASTSDIPDVSDMARRSEANTFTANNTFTAGQFNVGPLEVTSSGSILVNLSETEGWARSITWENNSDQSTKVMVGGCHNAGDAFVWMGVGDLSYGESQYRFYGTKMVVPTAWSLDDKSGNSLVWSESTQLAHLGRVMGTTKIRSGAVDLIHTKGTTDYKILDESNYSQYLPTTPKWTYGFVTINPRGNKVDFNTVLSGPDSPKILLNYDHELGNDTNAPTDMKHGAVLQIDGNYNSSYNNVALRPQLAFDVNHNVENGTRYMWFRTANNLGYGDSSNWKRVVTADEKPAGYVLDKNSYPALKSIEDGTTLTWLRAPQSGFIPFTAVNIANGGSGSLGSSMWAFKDAYIANVSANRYLFGKTGVDFRLDTNNKIAATISGSARGIEIGDLLVSSNYGADAVKVPTNGIFASGRIQSNDSMLVGYSGNVTEGMLGYGLYYDGTFAQGLGSEYSSGALILYKLLNPNIGKAGYNVPRSVTDTPCYLKLANGTLKLGVGATKAYTAGEAVTINEYEMATKNWATNTFYPLAGKGYLSFDAKGRPVMANNQGYSAKDKDGITREIMRVGPDNVIYMGNVDNSKTIIDIVFLYGGNSLDVSNIAQKRDLAKYLPLTGGTITDGLSVGANGSQPININNTNASATEVSQAFRIGGTSKGYFGYTTSTGVYMQNSDSSIICVKSNGAYFGTSTNTLTKLLTSTDLSGYATQTWASSKFSPLSTFKILNGFPAIDNTGNEYILTSNQSGVYVNYRTPSGKIIPTEWHWKDGTSTGYATGYWGNLYMVEKLVATQEWVSGRGYLTGITKSMVTTALGYTPPTPNTTYSQATSSTLGLVKVGATGLASKNYAVQLNSSGQMYVAVPWTDTNSTYSAATSSTYGLVKIGATGLASKNYAVQLNSSGQMYVSVPWTDTDTNTHYTTKLYAGASGTAANSAISNPYLKVTDDNAYRNQVRFIGAGATSISSDASGNITITSENTTYGLASSSSNGLMSSSQCTKLSKCIETVSAANMVTSVQVVDTIPGESSQVTGRLYLKFA